MARSGFSIQDGPAEDLTAERQSPKGTRQQILHQDLPHHCYGVDWASKPIGRGNQQVDSRRNLLCKGQLDLFSDVYKLLGYLYFSLIYNRKTSYV